MVNAVLLKEVRFYKRFMILKLIFSKMCRKKVLLDGTHVFFRVLWQNVHLWSLYFLPKTLLGKARRKWYIIWKFLEMPIWCLFWRVVTPLLEGNNLKIYLADLDKARGCSTNIGMINSVTESPFSSISFTAPPHPNN